MILVVFFWLTLKPSISAAPAATKQHHTLLPSGFLTVSLLVPFGPWLVQIGKGCHWAPESYHSNDIWTALLTRFPNSLRVAVPHNLSWMLQYAWEPKRNEMMRPFKFVSLSSNQIIILTQLKKSKTGSAVIISLFAPCGKGSVEGKIFARKPWIFPCFFLRGLPNFPDFPIFPLNQSIECGHHTHFPVMRTHWPNTPETPSLSSMRAPMEAENGEF